MSDKLLLIKFRAKLKKEGRSIKWFVNSYLKVSYSAFSAQLNELNPLKDSSRNAINRFLET
jgi:hypothetical protein